MDYGQYLVATLLCYVKAEGSFRPGGGGYVLYTRSVRSSLGRYFNALYVTFNF